MNCMLLFRFTHARILIRLFKYVHKLIANFFFQISEVPSDGLNVQSKCNKCPNIGGEFENFVVINLSPFQERIGSV